MGGGEEAAGRRVTPIGGGAVRRRATPPLQATGAHPVIASHFNSIKHRKLEN